MQNDLHRMEEEAAKLEEHEDVIYDDDNNNINNNNNNNNNKRRRIANKTSSRILLLKADQEFMLSLPANLSSHISPYLVVHIGRILGFQTEPRTSSWIHAGKSFNLYSICNCIFEELSGENTMITHKAKRTSSSSTTTIININRNANVDGSNILEENEDNEDDNCICTTSTTSTPTTATNNIPTTTSTTPTPIPPTTTTPENDDTDEGTLVPNDSDVLPLIIAITDNTHSIFGYGIEERLKRLVTPPAITTTTTSSSTSTSTVEDKTTVVEEKKGNGKSNEGASVVSIERLLHLKDIEEDTTKRTAASLPNKIYSILLNPTAPDSFSLRAQLRLVLGYADELPNHRPLSDFIWYSDYPAVKLLTRMKNPIDREGDRPSGESSILGVF
jgi:hypothetical protein